MKRKTVLIVRIVLIVIALGASACGSTNSENPTAADGDADPLAEATSSTSSQPSEPDPAPAPEDVSDIDGWAAQVGQMLLDYHEASFAGPGDASADMAPLDRWVDEATHTISVAEAAVAASPEPLGMATVDDAYVALVAAFDREAAAANAVLVEIEQNGPALEEEIASTPGATDTPLLIGTSLEPLTTEVLRPTAGRIDDACFELTDALADLTVVVLDCAGANALARDDAQVVGQDTVVVEVPGVTIEISSELERTVFPLTNGIQLQGGFRCLWIGRPAGIADPAGPAGIDPVAVGAMIDLPDDLGPWIDAHPALGLIAEGRADVAGVRDVPYWDVAIPNENIFFVFVNSDPPEGCFVIGFDDRARLHLIPHEGGPVLAIALAGDSPDPTEALSILDELSAVLDAITVVA